MPSKVQVLNFIGIVLQYSFLVLLYYFLIKVLYIMYRNLRPFKAGDVPLQALTHFGFEHNPTLVVVTAGGMATKKNKFILQEALSIGRSETSDIVIEDSFVSSEHACITKYKHGYWLADLNSTNGTIVNGTRISDEVVLNSGDVITIGNATFKFER